MVARRCKTFAQSGAGAQGDCLLASAFELIASRRFQGGEYRSFVTSPANVIRLGFAEEIGADICIGRLFIVIGGLSARLLESARGRIIAVDAEDVSLEAAFVI